ncbi:unnamed protein product [Bemisia tabaci]|uniref:Glucose-methanol-choline oxidoreductase N-terminal domain-containing protein n=1 Tax=Bemisia tabaci TaxID=7038 RepID=A0A9N9ZZ78_BEMTA|nr:unnamed protein product [Bemisia tabaci]
MAPLDWQLQCFLSLVTFAFSLYNSLAPKNRIPALTDAPQVQPEYDFVVIGGGSAGAVMANRLSELEDATVLLLEAGGQETDLSRVPLLASWNQATELDWRYRTKPADEKRRYCLAMTNTSCTWPRGKVVGGSSVLNYMLYVRGNRKDYDLWEQMGNPGWSYKEILKYFLKSEDNSNEDLLKTPYHASGGLLSVQDVPWTTPLAKVFLKAGKFLGYKTRDINGELQEGFTITQGTTRSGSRCSTSRAFAVTAQTRQNLDISMHSLVSRIGFTNKKHPKATKVHFLKNGKKYTVKVKKEVILSGGTINSPQTLMLSGIGPRDHLRSLGIKVVRNLPVGFDLQDHLSVGSMFFRVDKNHTIPSSMPLTPEAISQYLTAGTGPMTSLGTCEGMAFIYSKYVNRSNSWPDLQLQFSADSIHSFPKEMAAQLWNLRADLFDGTQYEEVTDDLFMIFPILLRPKSRGRITLRSKDPFVHPIIEPNYLAEPEDVAVLVDGMKKSLQLVNTPPFRQLNARPVAIPFPGCERHKLFSDEYLECCIRHFTWTFYHPTSTCSMGKVVDHRLKVIGVEG